MVRRLRRRKAPDLPNTSSEQRFGAQGDDGRVHRPAAPRLWVPATCGYLDDGSTRLPASSPRHSASTAVAVWVSHGEAFVLVVPPRPVTGNPPSLTRRYSRIERSIQMVGKCEVPSWHIAMPPGGGVHSIVRTAVDVPSPIWWRGLSHCHRASAYSGDARRRDWRWVGELMIRRSRSGAERPSCKGLMERERPRRRVAWRAHAEPPRCR